jgi:hypothetical protein
MKLTTHLYIVSRSKNAWSYASTPQSHLWHGAQLKHRDNFNFMFHLYLTYIRESRLDLAILTNFSCDFCQLLVTYAECLPYTSGPPFMIVLASH